MINGYRGSKILENKMPEEICANGNRNSYKPFGSSPQAVDQTP